jgi:hypothetical protein
MDRSRNLGPVFRVETLESSLAERYEAIVHWDIPKQPAFNTYEARLQYDYGWPDGRPDVRLLSAAYRDSEALR